eukprot:scaffold14272_cov157-Amphora_coffeaeformis.AAC.1
MVVHGTLSSLSYPTPILVISRSILHLLYHAASSNFVGVVHFDFVDDANETAIVVHPDRSALLCASSISGSLEKLQYNFLRQYSARPCPFVHPFDHANHRLHPTQNEEDSPLEVRPKIHRSYGTAIKDAMVLYHTIPYHTTPWAQRRAPKFVSPGTRRHCPSRCEEGSREGK